jgi:LytR cell envelope-related transcriptional attenuator
VKQNLLFKKLPDKINIKKSTANISFNIIIVLLAVIILYMSFSIFSKIGQKRQLDLQNQKNAKSSVIQVEVLNGCGVSGVADQFTNYLRQHHFDVVQMGNYISYDVEKSIVIDRTGNMINAYKVADTLGVSRKNVIQQKNSNYFLDVSFIIGKDFNSLKPYQ